MDKIKGLQLFCRVADLGSYSEAARERFISRSGVSRVISNLEAHFGVQLFKRSTRSLILTTAGKELYLEAEKILLQFEAMEDRIRRDRSEVKGILRVGVPGPLSERYILPDLDKFYNRFPKIKLSFQVSESLSDLYRDELDLVIRMGPLKDSSLMSVCLSPLSFVLTGSPEFLKGKSIIEPEDLKRVSCLCFRGGGRGASWSFRRGKERASVSVSGKFSASCGYTLRNMAVSGHGLVAMPRPLIRNELESGKLIKVMGDWELESNREDWGIHLMYHADRNPLLRVRAFIDFMKEPERLINKCNLTISVKS